MFDEALIIKTTEGDVEKKPFEMLQPIKKAKYPAISEVRNRLKLENSASLRTMDLNCEQTYSFMIFFVFCFSQTQEEEAVSLPLQTMCGAIFDAILVHMMNTVSTPNVWQPLKETMVASLNKQKVPHTLSLLSDVYGNSDIITLQEVSSSFIDQAKAGPLGEKYWINAPKDMDAVRDQNSVIMLNKDTFPSGEGYEITDQVYESFPAGVDVPVAKGDINAITAVDKHGVPFVIASFHGDTNGLATIPVNEAIVKTMEKDAQLVNHKLIFGLDANTYEKPSVKDGKKKHQEVLEWGRSYTGFGETSCWGDVPQPSNFTTFNARTYLQPQLNKACKSSEKREKGDVNPKDFILFKKGDFEVIKTWKVSCRQ